MNIHERAKALALNQCRFHPALDDERFVRQMAWQARHDHKGVLKPKQKWFLDMMVYRFRRQLGWREDIEVPTSPPKLESYLPPPKIKVQLSLI